MPWELQSVGKNRYNVVKQSDGKVVGHNLPKKRASAMMSALYANVKEPIKNALAFFSSTAGYPKGVDMKVAKKVDLIVLPRAVEGTNCGNCKWVDGTGSKMNCDNPEVKQPVTDRLCCALWDRSDIKRPWGKQAKL